MTDALTAAQVHDQVHALRAQAAQDPEKIELGRAQIAAILDEQRTASGLQDVGPLTHFQGLPVVKSRREDHVKLLATGEQGEDVEVETVEQPVASGPDAATVEAEPSGG